MLYCDWCGLENSKLTKVQIDGCTNYLCNGCILKSVSIKPSSGGETLQSFFPSPHPTLLSHLQTLQEATND